MQDARWLFFDLGNTLISEERAWERRIQRLVSSLERYGRRRAIEEVRAALREASQEFAPRLITRAIEKPDPAIFQLALSLSGCGPEKAVMIGDRLDNDIRPGRLLGWKTIRIAQGFARFQSPRDGLDEADLTLANLKGLIPVFMSGLVQSS